MPFLYCSLTIRGERVELTQYVKINRVWDEGPTYQILDFAGRGQPPHAA